MRFHVLTLFPDMVLSGLSESIIGKASKKGSIEIEAVNIRDFTEDKHKKVDDYPYGGGAGLLMQAQPVCDAHQYVTDKIGKKVRTIYLTPQGKPFHQRMAEELAKEEDLIFLCGHYEGIDERALNEVVTDFVSLGDFVLTGGELPAMVMIDAISRLVPGVLHNETSATDESFSGYLLEYPQYSRPEVFHGEKVPDALLSGNHKTIREWRLKMAEERTKERRPDLYAVYEKLMQCKKQLEKEDKLRHMGMTELIKRGQAKLLYGEADGVLLQDKKGGCYMLSAKSAEAGKAILLKVFDGITCKKEEVSQMVTHQEFMNEIVQEYFSMEEISECAQWTYTRKEALPVKQTDIRRLTLEYLEAVAEQYTLLGKEYVQERIESGVMYGAFVENRLAAFMGEHEEGSLGMLHVLPEYRGKGLACALESFLINSTLQKGYTPFGQVFMGNDASTALQQKLGLYPAKGNIWWICR